MPFPIELVIGYQYRQTYLTREAGGVLSERVLLDAEGCVFAPPSLSFEEAATLPCAGVTAWVVLFRQGRLAPDEWT